MPQLVALEWSGSEARVAVACGRAGHAVIEQAFSVLLYPAASEATPQEIGKQIAAALAAHGISKPDTLVAIGRASIELRKFQLPAAPDEELPEMVRFQAMREFSEMDERWLLDFMPIDEGGGGPRTVLATALAPDVVQEIRGVCEEAGLRSRRLVLRCCATAALLARRQTAPAGQLRLVIDLLADEADLTAIVDRNVVFLRTTRLADPPQPQALLAEIRLTLAAVQNQVGRRVESIVFCGQGASRRVLAEMIQQELEISTELFDPFEGLQLSRQLKDGPPEEPGRFAPLLGALIAEIEQSGHAIDFLHPRHPPPPPNRRRRLIMAAVGAGVLAMAYLVYARIDQAWLADETVRLEAESKRLDIAVANADKVRTKSEDIGKWADNQVVWLDHLLALSEGFPESRSAVLRQLTISPTAAGGEMRLKGFARQADSIAEVEKALHAHFPKVAGRDSREDRSMRNYSWRFETAVMVDQGAKP